MTAIDPGDRPAGGAGTGPAGGSGTGPGRRGFEWGVALRPVLRLADAIAHPATRAALSAAALAAVVGVNTASVPSEPLIFEGTRPATAAESAQHDIDHLRDLLFAQADAYREAVQ